MLWVIIVLRFSAMSAVPKGKLEGPRDSEALLRLRPALSTVTRVARLHGRKS